MKKILALALIVLMTISMSSAAGLYARPDLLKATVDENAVENGIRFPGTILNNDIAGTGKYVYDSGSIRILDTSFGDIFVDGDGGFQFWPSGKKGYALFYYSVSDDSGAVSKPGYVKIMCLGGC